MKITELNQIKSATAARKRNTSGAGGDFAGLLDLGETEASTAAGSAAPASPMTAMDAMLALQGVSEDESRRMQTIKQGNDLLDNLEQLRLNLLTGRIPVDVLRGLESRLNAQKQFTADPRLRSLIEDIELRAAVELAKLGF